MDGGREPRVSLGARGGCVKYVSAGPAFLAPRTSSMEGGSSTERGGRDGEALGRFKCVAFSAPFVSISLHRDVTQERCASPQAESAGGRSLFTCSDRSHLGVVGGSDARRLLLMSSRRHHFVSVAVTAENPASQRQDVRNRSSAFQGFCGTLRISHLDFNPGRMGFEVVSNILLRPPSFAISCGNVRKEERL